MNKDFDFSGWVTKNDIQCSDGVTIRHDAFRTSDGAFVPLVWQHDYKSPSNVLGKILLHNSDQGVYGYGYLNDTEHANDMRELLKHGDVNAMSIGARKIQKNGQDVVHGEIYEVSLVLKGANPGAVIEHVIQHSAYAEDSIDETQGTIYTGLNQDLLAHADKGENMATVGEVLDTLTEDQSKVVQKVLETGEATPEEEEVLATLTDEQVTALGMVIEDAADDSEDEEESEEPKDANADKTDEDESEGEESEAADESDDDSTVEQSGILGEEVLKHNAFYGEDMSNEQTITHEDLNYVVNEAVASRTSSLSSVIRHSGLDTTDDTLQHGITNIDVLFPATTLERGIQAYNPNAQNVEKIMGMFSASPKSRIKNIYADLTEEDARAKGYIKGNEKLDANLVSLYYRETTPQTIIHRTSIDRDDIIDIKENGIDSVSFLKQVQQTKFKEEILRAAILGDGRPVTKGGRPNPDKINEANIRPITTDDDLFTLKVTSDTWADVVDKVSAVIPAYQGSGQPVVIMNPFDVSKLRRLKDKNGRYLFGSSMDANRIPTNADLAAYFGATEIVEYRVMPQGKFLIGNLKDYVFGTSNGGQVATFDQFDMDFNQEKYLMEARMSGATLIPHAFIFVTVTNPEVEEFEEMMKFRTDALKQKPAHTIDSAEPAAKPGAKYKSKMASVETEKPAADSSAPSGTPGK